MHSQFAFLRGQYEEIIDYCDYLLRNSTDSTVIANAITSKERAVQYLERLQREDA